MSQHNAQHSVFTRHCAHLRSSFPLIKYQPVHGCIGVNLILKREKELWILLEEGWIKINFDGATRGNPSVLGVVVWKEIIKVI